MATKTKKLRLLLPVWLAAGALVITGAAALSTTAAATLIYSRPAVEQGEIWRLFSCHFVHASSSHLLWNLAAAAIAGWLLSGTAPKTWLIPVAATIALVGPAVHCWENGLRYFCGLSAIVTAMIVSLCLHELRVANSVRWIWTAALAALAMKTGAEWMTAQPLFAVADEGPVRVVPLAHLIGGAAGLLTLAVANGNNAIANYRTIQPPPTTRSS